MSPGTAAAGIATATAIAIALLLLVRRRAPAGGYFRDSDRAAGVFGVLGTSFAVLLGFVIFLAFESYSGAKADAEREATATLAQFEGARLFPPPDRGLLQGALLCYGRAVTEREWPAMEHGKDSSVAERWSIALDRAIERVPVSTAKERAAFGEWLRQSLDREQARRSRLLEARHPLPPILWFILILGAVVLIAYMLLWADSAERKRSQTMLIGSVAALTTASLLLIGFLNSPYGTHASSIKPTEMRQTVTEMKAQLSPGAVVSCDAKGD